jgi:hypothetical protein
MEIVSGVSSPADVNSASAVRLNTAWPAATSCILQIEFTVVPSDNTQVVGLARMAIEGNVVVETAFKYDGAAAVDRVQFYLSGGSFTGRIRLKDLND